MPTKNLERNRTRAARQQRERGAALITTLLLAGLLLILCAGLLVTTTLSASNAIDSTPEVQAYYAAESGLQATLGVLRGNAAPVPAFITQSPGAAVYEENKLSFRDAVSVSRSNLAGDPKKASDGSAFPARLSRWLPYDYTPPGGLYADRVTLTTDYEPANGLAYAVTVEELEDTETVSYSTTGTFTGATCSGGSCSVTVGTATDNVKIGYTPQVITTVNAASPAANSPLGSFTVTRTGTGSVVVPANVLFQISIDQTKPWPARLTFTGTLSGEVSPSGSTLKLTFSNGSAVVGGTTFAFASSPLQLNAPGGAAGSFPFRATITAPEPRRLLVCSTGYGPRGARKVLEMTVDRYRYLIDPPAPLVVRGSDDASQAMTFELGSSNAKKYTGKDASNVQVQLPTVAVRLHDWTAGYGGVGKGSTVDEPKFAVLDIDPVPAAWPASLAPVPSSSPGSTAPPFPYPATTPDFLRTADAARQFLDEMEEVARQQGRYFASLDGYAGGASSADLTFVDGDCTLEGGSGLLVVTGTLTTNGNDDFRGVVMVLGGGKVIRKGNGNGRVLGGWYVARLQRTRPAGCAAGCTPGTSGCAYACGFAPPHIDVSGGGNGVFQYDWKAIEGANRLLGLRVTGVVER